MKYRNWIIELNPKPGPGHDWDCTHEDYDGPEDGRYLTAGTLIAARGAIDDYEAEEDKSE